MKSGIPKIPVIVILGPTATGKTSLSIELARFLGQQEPQTGSTSLTSPKAEIISADSRQVYAGLNIGTGKITPEEMRGIPHHLLDVRGLGLDGEPSGLSTKRYSVADFTKDATRLIRDIHARGRIPIICGGTGFYIESLVRGIEYPSIDVDSNGEVGADDNTNDYTKLTTEQLLEELKQVDPNRAASIDPKNRRRIERALTLSKQNGIVPKLIENPPADLDFILIGITADPTTLRSNIKNRLEARLKAGMIDEVRELHKRGLSYVKMCELGLEYRYIGEFLQNQSQGKTASETELSKILETKIWQFARRQRTWFRRDNDMNRTIKWFEAGAGQPVDISKIQNLVQEFLAKYKVR